MTESTDTTATWGVPAMTLTCGVEPPAGYQEKAFEQFSSTKEEIVRTVAQDLFGEVLREVPQPPPPSA